MFEALKLRLKNEEEGNVPCMYLDQLGYVTTGNGHLLSISGAAAELPFVTPSGFRASPNQIRDEYMQVRQMEPNHVPSYYLARTVLRLPQPAIDALLDQDVTEKFRGLCALLPEAPGYPEPVQEALLDMAFELGPHGLLVKFPQLMVDVKASDWKACAGQCEVSSNSASRNQAVEALFLQAANGTGV